MRELPPEPTAGPATFVRPYFQLAVDGVEYRVIRRTDGRIDYRYRTGLEDPWKDIESPPSKIREAAMLIQWGNCRRQAWEDSLHRNPKTQIR